MEISVCSAGTGQSSIHVQIGGVTIYLFFFSKTPINVSVFSATDILVHQCTKNKAMLLLTITNTGAGSKVVTEAL